MPIVVDKEQKKRNIALACKALLVATPIHELKIADLAHAAKIGKGTFYEYFANKEELLFTLVEILMEEFNKRQEMRLKECSDIRRKLKAFAEFFYAEDVSDLRNLYKNLIGVSLLQKKEDLVAFQTECLAHYYRWFEALIDEAIEAGELDARSKTLARGLFATAKGLFVMHETTRSAVDLQQEVNRFIDAIIVFISTQKDHDASKA